MEGIRGVLEIRAAAFPFRADHPLKPLMALRPRTMRNHATFGVV